MPCFGMEKRTTLAELSDRGHANNFNLIRLLAAWAVIVSHSFPLTGVVDPLECLTGTSIGEISVEIFFLTSGFLVTRSLLVRQDLIEFVLARVLRIYPGLIVMALLTIWIAGAFSPSGFFSDPMTNHYFISTAFLWCPKLRVFELPGVFIANPYPHVVNGSLHTLPFELRMYVALAVLWAVAALRKPSRRQLVGTAIIALAVCGAVGHIAYPEGMLTHFTSAFFTGAACYVLRRRIVMDGRVAAVCLGVIVASASCKLLFPVANTLLLGYILFAASYLPTWWRPKHDYSYGTYIYAFPIQQSVALLYPGVPWFAMALLSTPVVLCLAAASWHLVEKPAMSMKSVVLRRFKTASAGTTDRV